MNTNPGYKGTCSVCGEEFLGMCEKHENTHYGSFALVEMNEGKFIGYNIRVLQTQEELDKNSNLPTFQVEKPGVLELEPVYQFCRNNGIEDFLVFAYVGVIPTEQ